MIKEKLFNIVEIFLCDYHQETFSTSEKIKAQSMKIIVYVPGNLHYIVLN